EVHMFADAFCNLFEEWEERKVTPSMMKRSKTVNGIHYFSYENIEIEEDEEIEQEPKQNNLQAMVLTNKKKKIITRLVNYTMKNKINQLITNIYFYKKKMKKKQMKKMKMNLNKKIYQQLYWTMKK